MPVTSVGKKEGAIVAKPRALSKRIALTAEYSMYVHKGGGKARCCVYNLNLQFWEGFQPQLRVRELLLLRITKTERRF